METWAYGHMDTRIHGHMDIWKQIYGNMDIWIHAALGSRFSFSSSFSSFSSFLFHSTQLNSSQINPVGTQTRKMNLKDNDKKMIELRRQWKDCRLCKRSYIQKQWQ